MHKIVITGGGGFIGSHIVDHMCAAYPEAEIVIFDKMTYAADFLNIRDVLESNRADLVVGDICDYELCRAQLTDADLLVHTAAESHVDRSFHSSILFTQTNALGTHTLMEACRETKVPRIIHVSTDEVYGEVLTGECDESAMLNPTNPYSASKAAAEMIVNGYRHSFKLPVIMVRANNMFGTRQFPEKLVPKSIMTLITGGKIPVHGTGKNVRHYLSAKDFAVAIALLADKGALNEVYNVGSTDEYANVEVIRMVCAQFGLSFDDCVSFVADRPFNDRRYAISWKKITDLGWKPQRDLKSELPGIVAWYKQHANHIANRMKRA